MHHCGASAATRGGGQPLHPIFGPHALVYRICEIANSSNCAQASVTVAVQPYLVSAVDNRARVSSKTPGTAIASVLSNDSLGTARATTANVSLSLGR